MAVDLDDPLFGGRGSDDDGLDLEVDPARSRGSVRGAQAPARGGAAPRPPAPRSGAKPPPRPGAKPQPAPARGPQPAPAPAVPTGPPTVAEKEAALRMAGWGPPPANVLRAVIYALLVASRRGDLRKRRRTAEKNRDASEKDADAAFIELGRALHARSEQLDLSQVSFFVGEVDTALLEVEQADRGKNKQAKTDARARLDEVRLKLGEYAVQRGLGKHEPERAGRAVAAVRAAEGYAREARIAGIAVDHFDRKAVQTGAVVLVLGAIVTVTVAVFAYINANA